MTKPRVLVLRAAGVNCNEETAHAFEMAGARTEQVHINRLLEKPELINEFDAAACPGGFSYGDDISAGRVMAIEIGKSLGDSFRAMLERGGLILGICNGFQVLIKSGLLPGNEQNGPSIRATLVENASNRYEDRWVRTKIDSSRCHFFGRDEIIDLPVAHAEGRFVAGSAADLKRLQDEGRAVLTYCDAQGGAAEYPANPNGAQGGIAGICDATGQVLGLMPHPERYLFSWQHPQWTRRPKSETGDGLRLFENAVEYLRG